MVTFPARRSGPRFDTLQRGRPKVLPAERQRLADAVGRHLRDAPEPDRPRWARRPRGRSSAGRSAAPDRELET
jgi:hypothetical protein